MSTRCAEVLSLIAGQAAVTDAHSSRFQILVRGVLSKRVWLSFMIDFREPQRVWCVDHVKARTAARSLQGLKRAGSIDSMPTAHAAHPLESAVLADSYCDFGLLSNATI